MAHYNRYILVVCVFTTALSWAMEPAVHSDDLPNAGTRRARGCYPWRDGVAAALAKHWQLLQDDLKEYAERNNISIEPTTIATDIRTANRMKASRSDSSTKVTMSVIEGQKLRVSSATPLETHIAQVNDFVVQYSKTDYIPAIETEVRYLGPDFNPAFRKDDADGTILRVSSL